MLFDVASITSRRNFLKASGVTLALPWMESLGGILHAADPAKEPRRLLLICLPLGIYRNALVPSEAGLNYKATDYLSLIDEYRNDYTIISGLDHPGVGGGHASQPRIFTGVPSNAGNRRSLDQYVASHVGNFTRYDALVLSAGAGDFSWTDSGSMVPAERSMAAVFSKLFLDENAGAKDRVLQDIAKGRSIMDFLTGQAKTLKPRLSATDQNKLDEYFETVRDTEQRLTKSESWVHTPKPKVSAQAPVDPSDPAAITESIRNALDVTYLAFKTDSTRVATIGYFRQDRVDVPGVNIGYHPLSHHGMDEGNITQLKKVESFFFSEFGKLLKRMKEAKEGNSSLLERTTILVTSNLGNGSNHSNRDLPILLAGGRFKHGQHLAFERSELPMSNLYVSMLNQMGIPDSSFATSTGPLRGLDLV